MNRVIYNSQGQFKLIQENIVFPDNSEHLLDYIDHPEVVIAIPELLNGNVLLVQQYRPILKSLLLECPGGKVDPGESLQEAISRELEEETGYTPNKLELIGYMYSSVGLSNEKISYFVAKDLELTNINRKEKHKILLKELSIDEIHNLLSKNEIYDAKSVVALYNYLMMIGFIQRSST